MARVDIIDLPKRREDVAIEPKYDGLALSIFKLMIRQPLLSTFIVSALVGGTIYFAGTPGEVSADTGGDSSGVARASYVNEAEIDSLGFAEQFKIRFPSLELKSGEDLMQGELENITCISGVEQALSVLGGSNGYQLCSGEYTIDGNDYGAPIIVGMSGQKITSAFLAVEQPGATEVRSIVRLFPLGRKIDLYGDSFTQLDVMQTLLGDIVESTEYVNGAPTKSQRLEFSTGSVSKNVIQRITGSTSSDFLSKVRGGGKLVEEDVIKNEQKWIGRSDAPKYIVGDGKMDELTSAKIADYKEMYPELDNLNPVKMWEADNPGFEHILVANFDSSVNDVDIEQISGLFNYFINLGRGNPSFQYGDVRIGIKQPVVIDTTIGLIPENVGAQNFVLGPEGYAYTNWSISEGSPNGIYVVMKGEGSFSSMPQVMQEHYGTSEGVNNQSLIVEICQSMVRAHMIEGGENVVDSKKTNIAQEVFCNSLGQAIYMKSRGISYSEYKQSMTGMGMYFERGDGSYEQYPFMILEREKWWKLPTLELPIIRKR